MGVWNLKAMAKHAPSLSVSPADYLEEIRELLSLNGENVFKIRAFERAADIIRGRDDGVARAKAGTLTEIDGIGKGIAQVLTELLVEGKTTTRDELKAALPEGLLELVRVPGLGPKKARTILETFEITTLAELEYACRENRLVQLPGFGEKAQKKILEGVEFLKSQSGKLLLSEALRERDQILESLRGALPTKKYPGLRISETGDLRRKSEVLSRLEFLIATPNSERARLEKDVSQALRSHVDALKGRGIEVIASVTELGTFSEELARTTASPEHWRVLEKLPRKTRPNKSGTSVDLSDSALDREAYESRGLPWIPPECREGDDFLKHPKQLDGLLPIDGIQGVFHLHTTESDGSHTLEEMVREAQRLGYRYLGVSDHSQSAFYAKGLKLDRLKAQRREIDAIQKKYPDVRIFWGIESDILKDGSLDYDAKTLEAFDFVIASIHSRFGMDGQAMTDRIVRAIENPHTTMIGHLTGRILLGRAGYSLDFDRIFKSAAEHHVVIELNSHPSRLDVDWRHGAALRKAGTWVSVNPDAHDLAGLSDTKYGVTMARKALLPREQILNSRSVSEVETWLKNR